MVINSGETRLSSRLGIEDDNGWGFNLSLSVWKEKAKAEVEKQSLLYNYWRNAK